MEIRQGLTQAFKYVQLLRFVGVGALPRLREIWAFFTAPLKRNLEDQIIQALLTDFRKNLGPSHPERVVSYVRSMTGHNDNYYQVRIAGRDPSDISAYKFYHGMVIENLMESVLGSESGNPILRGFVNDALSKLAITGTVVRSPKGQNLLLLSPGYLQSCGAETDIRSSTVTSPAEAIAPKP